jgi:hypothetical protein
MPAKTKPQTNEASASAKLTMAHLTPDKRATLAQKVGETVKAHPNYNNHPEIQQSLTSWLALAAGMSTSSAKIDNLKQALAAENVTLQKAGSAFNRGTKMMLAVVDTASGGSEEDIKKWGFEIVSRTPAAPTSDAPQNLRVIHTKDLSTVIRWNAIRNNRGYMVQMGDGTPNGFGAPIPCARARYAPTGLTVGQKVTFRVAVQRKNGMSAWSAEVSIVVR